MTHGQYSPCTSITVDDPTQHIPPLNCLISRNTNQRHWTLLNKPLMRPSGVVEAYVLPERTGQVPRAHDQELVETFLANGAHKALGNGVGIRGVEGVDVFKPLRLKDDIKASCELRVVVVDKETYRQSTAYRRKIQVRFVFSVYRPIGSSNQNRRSHERPDGSIQWVRTTSELVSESTENACSALICHQQCLDWAVCLHVAGCPV
jgi:hypothetical protein